MAAVAAHAVGTGAWPLSLFLGFAAGVATRLSQPQRPINRWLLLGLAAAGVLLGAAIPAIPPFTPAAAVGVVARSFAAGSLAMAVLALVFRQPPRGRASPIILALGAVVASGMARPGPLYVVAVALFALTALATLCRGPTSGPPLRALGRGLGAVLGAAGAGLVLSLVLILSLPPAYDRVGNWMMSFIRPSSTSGMSDGVWLQRHTDITPSDEVALRVYGDSPALLRGYVLTSYRQGRWGREPTPEETVPSASTTEGPIEVVPVKASRRYFLPLGAQHIRFESGHAQRDRYGQLGTPAGQTAGRAWFAPGSVDVTPPAPTDTQVPPEIAAAITKLARAWTTEADSPAARVAAITRHLHAGYTYALQHERKSRQDPVLDFLIEERSGHCEYFASAMALLARAAGVPARVVAGYRVHEVNPVGGYSVVRERDAHAWVEAWVDGKWQSYDPTPPAYLESLADQTSLLRGLSDWLVARWHDGALLAFLIRAAVPLLIALGIVALVRRVRGRRRNLPERPVDVPRPWPEMEALLRALAQRGWSRAPSETLEHFSDRIREHAAATAQVIDAYACHRYGGQGSREDLQSRLRHALDDVRPL
jgi:hypothetical protein